MGVILYEVCDPEKEIECGAVIDGDFFPENPTTNDFVNRVPCLLGQGSRAHLPYNVKIKHLASLRRFQQYRKFWNDGYVCTNTQKWTFRRGSHSNLRDLFKATCGRN